MTTGGFDMLFRPLLTLSLIVSCALPAFAEGEADEAIKARKSQMTLYAFNLAPLGAMAKGTLPYDADLATKAATNLARLTKLDQSRIWMEGTDQLSAENTRALPEIWENMDDVMAKALALSDSTDAMQVAAGTDLASLQAAMGALGGACSACHKVYRAPE
ncbi:c-type cytochrome [Pseudogemmobacter sp. W21_MBD1_M6]|uniref:c-type cytochrome n=1 Tax=Pseudogemmobacter sp. W21_MBD1_M6 TaxID=3240271 RepID=UPI003F99BC0F